MGEVQRSSGSQGEGGQDAGLGPTDGARLFDSKPDDQPNYPVAAWGAAVLVVLAVVGALVYMGRTKPAAPPSTLQPADPYASSLALSQFAMSESANLTGGKLTYLDGHVSNTGSRTVTGVMVQVVFQNDEALAPQIDTVPLTLIRMKDPYVDTQPVSANPLKPGDDREFRLTFETVPDNWNQQMPELRVIRAELK
jgi:hypothetical protein